MSTYTLCLCLLESEIQVYKSHNQVIWDILPIQGETVVLHQNRKEILKGVLQECSQRLNLDTKLEDVTVNVLYTAQDDYSWLSEILKELHTLKNKQVQILQWQSLIEYASKNLTETVPNHLNAEWISQYVLPLTCLENSWQEHQKLIDSLNLQKQIKQEQLQVEQQQVQSHSAEQLAKYQMEKQKLQAEIRDLQQKLVTVQRPNLDNLMSYLPSIFKNFWNTVRPEELANIAGLLDVPKIESPFHNPSNPTVQIKKRQFQALAETEQQQIIAFCRQLKQHYNLNLHLEFQPIIGALD